MSDPQARQAYDGLSAVLKGQRMEFTMQYPCHSDTQERWFLMHVAPVAHPGGGAVVSHLDISGWIHPGQSAPLLPAPEAR